jgi:hypothetical protein
MATSIMEALNRANIQKAISEGQAMTEKAYDRPWWHDVGKFVLPFAISAALPGIGAALSGAAAGGGGLLGFLGKGLQMGKATGVQSFLHGLLTKGTAHVIGGKGGRGILDAILGDKSKEFDLKDKRGLDRLYLKKPAKKLKKDYIEGQKQAEKAYMLADLKSAAAGSILGQLGLEDGSLMDKDYNWTGYDAIKAGDYDMMDKIPPVHTIQNPFYTPGSRYDIGTGSRYNIDSILANLFPDRLPK